MTALLPSHPGDDVLLEGLRKHFGLDTFRAGQAEVIASVMAGRNTVAVMPTGAGKSLCYQLPATLLDGVTLRLVVSPLIALMHDQVEQLTARGIPAAFLNSTLSDLERAERMTALRDGRLKLLYCAPERLRSEPLLEALTGRLSLLAVDEAHPAGRIELRPGTRSRHGGRGRSPASRVYPSITRAGSGDRSAT